MALYRLEVASFAYPVEKIKHLILGKPQYGANERGVERASTTIPRYIRITDIDAYGRLNKEIGVTAEVVEDKYILEEGDLLFARSGNTVGKAYLHSNIENERCLFAGYMIRCRANTAKVLPEYLFLCTQLEFYKHWVAATQRATGQPNINAEEYRNLEIPFPDLGIQQNLVKKYRIALRQYESDLSKAKGLLSGIDDYLLVDLGITFPPEPENTISSRIFTAQHRELAGWRFDARVHRYNFKLTSTLYPNVLLKEVVDINPRTTFRNVHDETMLTFLPMEAISDVDGTVVSAQERVLTENIGYTNFQEGDLIWAKITPCMENGKSVVAENLLNGYGFGSTEYHVLRPKSAKIDVHYLHALLRIKRLRIAATSYFGGSSGHQRVDQAFFRFLEIPLPDICTQQTLVEHIEACRKEAKCLQSEAETEFETAKRRIEAMLLGEVVA